MEPIRFRSLRFRLSAFIILIFSLLIILVAVNNLIAYKEIKNKIYETMKETLTIYQNRLTESFDTTVNYLKNFAYEDGDIRIIDKHDLSSEQWFSSVYHVQKSFRSAVTIYDMDGFFLFSLTSSTYFAETQANSTSNISKNIKSKLTRLIEEEQLLTNDKKDKWFPLEIKGKYYLFRVIKVHNSYIGCWISTGQALNPLVGKELTQEVFLVTDKGVVTSNNPPIEQLPVYSITDYSTYHSITIRDSEQLIVSCEMDFGDLYLVSLIPENQFFVDINKYIPFLIKIFFIMLGLLILAAIIISRLVIRPLTELNKAISSLKNGDLNATMPVNAACTEFEEVNSAFNEMVQEIKTLKIGVYEEKLSRQQIYTQYLSLQITPHFLINCLNMAYQLAELNRSDLLKPMLKYLSQYLRYTLSSGQTVSLKQELMHVENYIELSKIRYPGSIDFYTDINPGTHQATVIPLLLQSFIENTIKYEAVLGKVIAIHISSEVILKDSDKYIKITIWDTGSGFHEKILKRLQDTKQYIKDTQTQHIGISNVLQRTALVFGSGVSTFSFSNRPGAGAQIDIEIPFIPIISKEDIP